ncbi:Ras- protein Rab-4A [Coelomomyces lativittatus]|nr:Ras- protein Rab-4A [Coelomomyces lativittatus]
MSDVYDFLFKFLIVGSAGTGKSCLLYRFLEDKFRPNTSHTIGVEFGSKVIQIGKYRIKLQIWDTAGQERFKSVTRSYYRDAAGALLVFDVSNRESFTSLITWLKDAQTLASPNIVIVMVGHKSDLDSQREISYDEANEYAKQHDLVYIEASSITGNHVQDAFHKCASIILSKIEAGKVN